MKKLIFTVLTITFLVGCSISPEQKLYNHLESLSAWECADSICEVDASDAETKRTFKFDARLGSFYYEAELYNLISNEKSEYVEIKYSLSNRLITIDSDFFGENITGVYSIDRYDFIAFTGSSSSKDVFAAIILNIFDAIESIIRDAGLSIHDFE
jgi:uncharacterized protein YcfL